MIGDNHRQGVVVPMRYRLLGHEEVALTRQQLEEMVRNGVLSGDTKILRDGEGFATALRARDEFQHLFAPGDAKAPIPRVR